MPKSSSTDFVRTACRAKLGGIVLAHILSVNGRILGEVTITRFAEDRYYLLSAAGAELRDLDHLMQGRREGEDVDDREYY